VSRSFGSVFLGFEVRFRRVTFAIVTTAKRVLYEGRVQGVGFRFRVKEIAQGFDVVGTVQNLPDGRVLVVAQGELGEVEAFLDEILQSSLKSHIHKHVDREITLDPNRKGFRITG
jgi:acylphosphatase